MPILGIDFPTILPLIGAVFVFLFGVFFWFKSTRQIVHVLFLGFSVAITYWLFGTFMMFIYRDNPAAILLWDRFVYLGVVFVPSFMHHFSLAVTNNKGQRKLLAFSYAFSVFFLILSRTPYFVDGVYVFPRVVHSKAQIGHHVFLLLFFAISSLLFYNLYIYYRKNKNPRYRRSVLLVGAAFLNILLIGGSAYLPAYGIDIGYPFSYVSGIIFVIVISFAIANNHFISIRAMMIELFVFLVTLVFVANVLTSFHTWGSLIVNTIFFSMILLFGFLVIGSTRKISRQRESLRKLTQDLREANLRLGEISDAKSEFVSIASHELRTPVSVMKGYLSLIRDGTYGPIRGALKEKVSQVYSMNERLVHLIGNLLNLTRLERGSVEFLCSEMDAAPLVREVVGEMTVKAGDKNLQMRFEEPELPLPKVWIDPDKLREVLVNLLDNAVKYTPKGSITVSMSFSAPDAVDIKVTDTGVGMRPEDEAKIFQKYFRGNNGSYELPRQSSLSMGLGLYICAKFIRGMGGDIWVEKTSPQQGTTMAVSLPTEPGGVCAIEPEPPADQSGSAAAPEPPAVEG